MGQMLQWENKLWLQTQLHHITLLWDIEHVMLVQVMNGFQPGNHASNAVKSAPWCHCVDVGAYNHFAGRLSATAGLAGAYQIATGISPTLKPNLFKL